MGKVDSDKEGSEDWTRFEFAPEETQSRGAVPPDDSTIDPDPDPTSFSKPPDVSEHALEGGDDLPGLRVGPRVIKERFILEELIGVGGMGAVYKARDQRRVEAQDRNPWVALKLLNDKFKMHPAAFLSLQREASKAQSLAHPNIVPVYDFDRAGDLVFMTMELQRGASLEKIIKNHPSGIPYSKALKITQKAGRALQYAHEQGIVHADFKPGNVFLTEKGRVKIFDFGIARAVKHLDEAVAKEDTAFDPSTLGGLTPAYATWEMLKGEEPGTSDDVFALACMFYELLTGKHPYRRIPVNRAWKRLIWPRRIKSLKSAQWRVLRHALSARRKKRYKSVDTFLSDFVDAGNQRSLQLPADKIFLLVSIGLTAVLLVQTQHYLDERQTRLRFEAYERQWSQTAQHIRHRGLVHRENLSTALTDFSPAVVSSERLALTDLYEDTSWLDRYSGFMYTMPPPLVNRWQAAKQNFLDEASIHRRWWKRFDSRAAYLLQAVELTPLTKGRTTCESRNPLPQRCEDFMFDGTTISLIALPVRTQGQVIAMGEREVSKADFRRYCESTGECADTPQAGEQPVTALSITQINRYLEWIGSQTGYKYRLPTMSQWQSAAMAGNLGEQRNSANCLMPEYWLKNEATNLIAGDDAYRNAWGLINMVGNAREVVRVNYYHATVGGSHISNSFDCTAYQVENFNATGDLYTGFRFVRYLPITDPMVVQ